MIIPKLGIPPACMINRKLHKKQFYDFGELSPSDKKMFSTAIDKIQWVATLKKDNTNIDSYADTVRLYEELVVIHVVLRQEAKVPRMAEMIMRTIPYPALVIFELEAKAAFYGAHQRTSLKDSSRNTLEQIYGTAFVTQDDPLIKQFGFQNMSYTNLYAFYTDMLQIILAYNLAAYHIVKSLNFEQAEELLKNLKLLETQIISLKSQLQKEKQFNRKMELNMQIKQLEQQIKQREEQE